MGLPEKLPKRANHDNFNSAARFGGYHYFATRGGCSTPRRLAIGLAVVGVTSCAWRTKEKCLGGTSSEVFDAGTPTKSNVGLPPVACLSGGQPDEPGNTDRRRGAPQAQRLWPFSNPAAKSTSNVADGPLLARLLAVGAATADDVRDAVELPDTLNPKLFGAVPGPLAEAGIIRAAGFVRTRRPEGHARPVLTWELIDAAAARFWLGAHPDLPDPELCPEQQATEQKQAYQPTLF